MGDFLKSIISAGIGASIVGAICTLIFKRYLEFLFNKKEDLIKRNIENIFKEKEELVKRQIDHLFKKKESYAEAVLKAKLSSGESLFNKELAIYPEIVEIIYRCRNLARELTQNSKKRETVIEFSQCASHLHENVYKYRIFLSGDTFRKIHRFKGEVQELSIVINEINRSLRVDDAPVDPDIHDLAKNKVVEKYKIINDLYDTIIPEIQTFIQEKSNLQTV